MTLPAEDPATVNATQTATTDPRSEARSILALGGPDRRAFLQDLVTNKVPGPEDGLVYAALLTPQGKYLADFFLFDRDETLYLDTSAALVAGLTQRLTLYRLRRKVTIEPSGLSVARGTGTAPEGAFADPRHPDLGWRAYGDAATLPEEDATDWDALRVTHCIPATGIELIPDETFPLEAGFERLNGVDFRKGCYVGQEVTARMKHKTELRKGLATVDVSGEAPVGTPILASDRAAGALYTQAGGRGIAYLRFDRAEGAELSAGAARVTWAG
ncbi:folate-binding protein [Mesobaculum littorinae]|uniref:Folate-binding protein n=1 Tax=Mesobaculum littorinae TaxID=2486419 RepID=A0A438ALM2_9RHOB|nr:folate-binding protein YgfZ [Mesobaculum littorinae]RVV99572.1 folate-binding protein [Mesobaculum littorinae]